jgi:hypothetical protein
MSFKSKTQPLCRCCGKKIAKHTVCYFMRPLDYVPFHSSETFIRGGFATKDEVQRAANGQVVSVKYNHAWGEDERRTSVYSAHLWDGESYVDAFFCKGTCSTLFAYVMARAGHSTVAFNNALRAREEKEGVKP